MRAERFELGTDAPELAAELRARAPQQEDVRRVVAEVVEDVRSRGDAAVLDWTRRFEGDEASPGFASAEELRAAPDAVDPAVRAGLEVAIANVRRVAEAELQQA